MQSAPTIIKKVRKGGGGGGHHGGAWKVAYADFVTAMMAFFLLLWLLNATTEEQKRGISNYFAPTSISQSTSGAGGVMQGRTMSEQGAMTEDRSMPAVLSGVPRSEEDREIDPADARAALEREEDAAFEAVEQALRNAIAEDPGLADLAENLIIDRMPEGLRIQIVDQDKYAMFPSGRADMYDHALRLMEKISTVIASLPNRISVRGHTDAIPYRGGQGGYSNWELSADRANSSRRALVGAGLATERIVQVMGMADTDPLLADEPASPRNRRISIVLLRESETEKR